MEVTIDDRQEDLALDHSKIPAIIERILQTEGVSCDALSVYFITNEEMCQMHLTHFDDPSPTDCISFPIDPPSEPYCFLGELFICPKIAIEYCQVNGGSSLEEVTLYLVHCILHLLGYDDIDDKDKEIMRKKEKEIMSQLKQDTLFLTEC